MQVVTVPKIIKGLTKSKIHWNVPGDERSIYLTFDDGPTPEITDKVLEILQSYQWKATFFCVGNNVKKYPDIYKKIQQQNHSVGNHTFDHLDGWKTSISDYIKNVNTCGKYVNSNIFRPPYGKLKPSQLNILSKSYKIIFWSLLSYDFKKELSPQSCLKLVMKNLRPGSIIVFHDSQKASKNMLYTLPKLLEELAKKKLSCLPLKYEKIYEQETIY